MNTDSLRYAGFGPRLASLLLDFFVTLPLGALALWGTSSFRLFDLYFLIPITLFELFYYVYLVRRYGGTPGKLLAGIVIRKVDGTPVGYREAFLRFSVTFVFSLLTSMTLLFPLLQMTDAEYFSLSFMERGKRMIELAPLWYTPLNWAQTVWFWSELIVLLTNKKRRALHDFIAGTVVVYASPSPETALKPDPALQGG
ncbi:MAG: RDD family protein [Verrucomicrobia bacterium]|nr:RDD family protein [Verrucomicrobiota bacterium]